MQINVTPKHRISGDRYGFTIEQMSVVEKGKNAGTETWTAVGHYASLSGAIIGLTKIKAVESQATTLQELLQEIKEHREFIESKVAI